MSLLVAATLLLLLGVGLTGPSGRALNRASPALLAAMYGAPAVLLLVFVLWLFPEEAKRLRGSLLAWGLRAPPQRAAEFTVGGDRDLHDIWIAGFSGPEGATPPRLGTLRFDPTPATGDENRRLVLELPEQVIQGTLVEGQPGVGLLPVPSLRLEEGDLLGFGGLRFRFSAGRRLIGRDRPQLEPIDPGGQADGDPLPVPLRWGEIPLLPGRYPVLRALGPSLRTHPLGHLATASRERVASFLYRAGGGLHVAVFDRDLRLVRDGDAVEPQRDLAVPSGTRLHAAALPLPTDSFEAGGLRDLRSFRLLVGERSVLMPLDTPEVVSLAPAALLELAERRDPAPDADNPGANAGAKHKVQLALADWRLSDRYLHFRHASTGIAGESFATLELPRDWAHSAPSEIELVSPQGRRSIPIGEPFWLGSDRRAALRLDFLELPLALALFALLLVPFKVIAGRACGVAAAMAILAGALELLLVVRLLLAYRVWAGFPFREEAWDLALVAWGVLPWSLLLTALPWAERFDTARLLDGLPAVGGGLVAIAWTMRLVGVERASVWAICLVGSAATVVLRSRGWRDRWSRWWHVPRARSAGSELPPAGSGRWRRLAARTRAGARAAVDWRPDSDREWVLLFCALPLLVCLARLALALIGARESLPLFGGLRFSLSLVHVPVLILLEAWYLSWLWQRWRVGVHDGLGLLPALGLLLGGWLLPSFLVSDFGLALVNVAVLLLALAALSLSARGRVRSHGAGWGMVPAAALVAYLLLISAPFGVRLAVGALPDSWQAALEADRNYQRFLAFAYPSKLEEVGRRTSEEMAVMNTVLDRYTRGEHALRGRGYFASALSPHIEATALREHTPAVFLVSEWGLAGVLGVILAYLAAGAVGTAVMPGTQRSAAVGGDAAHAFAGALGLLATLTIAIPSLYMILANYGLVLFTGRNAYLLGLDSNGDVLESLALFALAGFALALLQEERRG